MTRRRDSSPPATQRQRLRAVGAFPLRRSAVCVGPDVLEARRQVRPPARAGQGKPRRDGPSPGWPSVVEPAKRTGANRTSIFPRSRASCKRAATAPAPPWAKSSQNPRTNGRNSVVSKSGTSPASTGRFRRSFEAATAGATLTSPRGRRSSLDPSSRLLETSRRCRSMAGPRSGCFASSSFQRRSAAPRSCVAFTDR